MSIFLISSCFSEDNYFFSNFNGVTISSNVTVYLSGSSDSSNQVTMDIGHLVKIISNSNQSVNIEKQSGTWLFIDSQYANSDLSGTIKGWVPSYSIAQKKEFKRVEKFGSYHLEGMVGDAILDFQFNKDGTFKQKTYNDKGKFARYETGTLYQKGKLIYAKSRKFIDFFYLDEAGNLYTTYPDVSGNPIQAKRLDK
jgi:hypothetical protein